MGDATHLARCGSEASRTVTEEEAHAVMQPSKTDGQMEKITLANEQGRVTEEARKGIAFPNGSNPKITYVKGMRRAGLLPESDRG
jgi:hypothetical protein